MCQAHTFGQVLAPGRTPSAPKQWKQDVHVKKEPCQCEIATDEIQEEKNL